MKWTALCLGLLLCGAATAQKPDARNLVYVDDGGVLRYSKDGKEAAFFGVNYTVPFAYGFRSHKALGVNIEKAIDADVAHLARLGLDAFRVHVWDVEITDSAGNLLNNEHLRLFDYLLMRLKEKNIRIVITPIAFWGNGYPERDEKTPGFATRYGKGPSVVKEEAIVAQERYLQQFFTHVNPYTKLTYVQDPDVIATELNNEPHHSGPRERTTEYVNRLAAAVRGTGWTKPVFYNISESPSYAGAVAAAHVDGHSFQWYPTGLVAGRTQLGNFLPNVDRYDIPFIDSVPAFKNRARMVYEFDAGDVLQSNMYPAMARSFRTAGFQWATQFAYDPMYTAHANTEYQTHFLNLLYTPGKAISLMIAGKAFHQLPRGKSWGSFPADTSFDAFRVSYVADLSEMNTDEEFIYSNNTATAPRNAAKLRHITGVGSSPVVRYEGSGAYFLDKIGEGRWRLELYPDALIVADPFGKASPARDVVRLQSSANRMELMLPGLPADLKLVGIDSANRGVAINGTGGFLVRPGVYEIGVDPKAGPVVHFALPPIGSGVPFIAGAPTGDRIAGAPMTLSFQMGNVDERDNVSVELRHSLNRWKTIQLQRRANHVYAAGFPADMREAGIVEYRVIVWKGSEAYVFPSGKKGDPYAWDDTDDARYTIRLLPAQQEIVLFDPLRDRDRTIPWIRNWQRQQVGYGFTERGTAVIRASLRDIHRDDYINFRVFTGDRIQEHFGDSAKFSLRIQARMDSVSLPISVALVDRNGNTLWCSMRPMSKFYDFSTSNFHTASYALLPRPYPGFQPEFLPKTGGRFDINALEHIEISVGGLNGETIIGKAYQYEIESIKLIKE